MGYVTTGDLHKLQKRRDQAMRAAEVHEKQINPERSKTRSIQEAVKYMKALTKPEEIRSFIEGEERRTLTTMAENLLKSFVKD